MSCNNSLAMLVALAASITLAANAQTRAPSLPNSVRLPLVVVPASGPGITLGTGTATTSINSTSEFYFSESTSGGFSARGIRITVDFHTGANNFQQDSVATLNRILNSAQPINGTSGVIGLINPDSILQQGNIKIPVGGSIYLTGIDVTGKSVITTTKDETILAAGSTVSLSDSATPGIKVDVTGAKGNVTNLGAIMAEVSRTGIAGGMLRNSGQPNVNSVVNEGGRLFLRAGPNGQTLN